MSGAPEFARPFRLDTLGASPRAVEIAADEAERAALAERFALIALARLSAQATLRREGDAVIAEGRVTGEATQACVATGEPVPAHVDEPFALKFVPAAGIDAEELELDEGDLDTVGYEGAAIDLGEAAAQSFALALDPFPRAADAAERLSAAGVLSEDEAEAARIAAGPFAVLKTLRDD